MRHVFEKESIDILVHLAARAGVRPSISNPRLYFKVNLEGTVHLLECCRDFGVKKMIFASSSSVYGNNRKVPFSETDPVDNPISPYAATKKAGELLCYTYHHLYGMDITCLRFFTVLGTRQRPEMAIHLFTDLMAHGKEIHMFGEGSPSRDYTYIDDITDGILRAIVNLGGYDIYNLGRSSPVSPVAVGFDQRAYDEGARIFEAIARDAGGRQRLVDYLRGLHARRSFAPFTTLELADDLRAQTGVDVRERFVRWLYTPGGAALGESASAWLHRVDLTPPAGVRPRG